MPTLTIDGRTVRVEPGTTILEAARGVGIDVPTLCHHEALEPWGGCRLCLVDVTRPQWDGWTKAVVSCMARAEEGLVVTTQSDRIRAARQVALELLLARCPGSSAVRSLAAQHGVAATSFRPRAEADDCVLCGLCTRVCESYATSAIATWGRGTSKAVGTFAHEPPEDCVGCGACALLCPTGHVGAARRADGYEIWGRRFAVHRCRVDSARCIGCGACEERCPFSVPRVVLGIDGSVAAVIAGEHCRGCGACVGVCPTGAIEQERFGWPRLVRAEAPRELPAAAPHRAQQGQLLTVLACGRAALGVAPTAAAAERATHLLEVPCSGRATAAMLLARLALGDQGVLVVGRHEQTCRLRGAEQSAREAVAQARALLALAGIEPDRVAFVSPDRGASGVVRGIDRFRQQVAALPPLVLGEAPPDELLRGEGDATALGLTRWLSTRVEPTWPPAFGEAPPDREPRTSNGRVLLYAGDLPYLAALGPGRFRPADMEEVLRQALATVASLGWPGVRPLASGYRVVRRLERATLDTAELVVVMGEADRALLAAAGVRAERLDDLLRAGAAARRLRSSEVIVACDGSAEQVELVEALGAQAVDVGPDPFSDDVELTAAWRRPADERLRRAERLGATALLATDPAALARWALLCRDGSWRRARPAVVLGHQLLSPPATHRHPDTSRVCAS